MFLSGHNNISLNKVLLLRSIDKSKWQNRVSVDIQVMTFDFCHKKSFKPTVIDKMPQDNKRDERKNGLQSK